MRPDDRFIAGVREALRTNAGDWQAWLDVEGKQTDRPRIARCIADWMHDNGFPREIRADVAKGKAIVGRALEEIMFSTWPERAYVLRIEYRDGDDLAPHE